MVKVVPANYKKQGSVFMIPDPGKLLKK